MADNDLEISIGFTLDETTADKIQKEATTLEKSLSELGRKAKFDALAKSAAEFARESGNTSKAVQSLNQSLSELGASEKEINRAAGAFEKYNQQLERDAAKQAIADQKALQKELEATARAAEKAAKEQAAAAEKAKRDSIRAEGANERFGDVSSGVGLFGDVESGVRTIGGAAGAFGATGLEDVSSKLGEIFAVFEAVPRTLAAVQGLPETFNAAAQAFGLVGEGATGLGANLVSSLTPALGGTAAATIAVAAPLLAVTAAVVALTAVLSAMAAEAQAQADQLNEIFEAQRSVTDEIVNGLDTAGAEEAIEKLKFRQELEQQTLADAQQAYQDYMNQIRESFGVFGTFIAGIVRVFDPREDALAGQIAQSQEILDEAATKERAYNKAIEDGLTAKNDAAAAEKNRAKEQEQASKAAEKASRDATRQAEQAAKEQARAQEKAAQEQQRASDTAAREAESNAKRAADAAKKYADAQQSAAKDYARSIEDAGKKLKQSQSGIATKAGQAESDAQRKNQQAALDLQLKAQQEELKAAKDHERALAAIRKQGDDAEQSAREGRNFLQIAELRKNTAKQLEAENEKFLQERSAAGDAYRQQREDLQRQQQIEAQERKIAFARQLQDAKSAYAQDLETAKSNNTRKLEDAKAAYADERKQLAQHLGAMSQLYQNAFSQQAQAFNQTLGSANGSGGNKSFTSPQRPFQPFNAAAAPGGSFGGGIGGGSRTTNNNTSNSTTNTNNVTINTNNPRDVLRVLGQGGYARR